MAYSFQWMKQSYADASCADDNTPKVTVKNRSLIKLQISYRRVQDESNKSRTRLQKRQRRVTGDYRRVTDDCKQVRATTNKSQTTINKSQISQRRLQTNNRRLQTITDDYRRLQTTTNKSQTTINKSQRIQRRLQTNNRRLQTRHRQLQMIANEPQTIKNNADYRIVYCFWKALHITIVGKLNSGQKGPW